MGVVVFLVVGSLLGGLVTALVGLRTEATWDQALLLGLPPGYLLGAFCLAARFPARAVPFAPGRLGRVAVTHVSAAAVSIAGWVAAGYAWAGVLERIRPAAGMTTLFAQEAPTLAVAGMLIYLLAVTVHYLQIALEAAGAAEVRGVESRVLAREAELRALRAQVDPHFLFNSLNSIATLTTESPADARRMCLLLAGFLRRSLALGRCEQIPLGDELALVGEYLAIEKIRFGARLAVVERLDADCRDCPVPPLLLQPLVENAVRHGIAQLVEGGTLRIDGRREAAGVVVTVENPRESGNSGRPGTGMGLENVRGRLAARHGGLAAVEVEGSPSVYRVRLFIPWDGTPAASPGPAAGKESDGSA